MTNASLRRSWTTTEVQFLRQHYGKVGGTQLATQMGRSLSSIQNQARILKLKVKEPGRPWTTEEEHLISQHYDATRRTTEQLARKLNRTYGAIKQRAQVLGLTRNYWGRSWEREEIELVERLLGDKSISEILQRLNELCQQKGWSKRSRAALKIFVNKTLHASVRPLSTYSARQLAQVLGCDRSVIKSWLSDKAYCKFLKPERESEAPNADWMFSVKGLRKFFTAYPGELTRCRPDLIWLVTVLTGGEL